MTRSLSAALCAALLLFSLGCSSKSPSADSSGGTTGAPDPSTTTPLDVKKTDVKVGTGDEAKDGDTVFVTYKGTLKNGTVFDSNDKPTANPYTVIIGQSSVIQGWHKGLVGMKVGGVRKIEVPPALAYGAEPPSGSGIPPNSTLYFELKLLAMIKPGDENLYEKKDIKVGTGPAVAPGKRVTMDYKASLVNGRRIDSTIERKAPVTFTVGKREIISGLEAALMGMKAGGERWIRIPPNIGYGPYGMNNVPGNSIVDFEVKLLSVK